MSLRRTHKPAEPIPVATFAACLGSERNSSDPWVSRFLGTDRWMRNAATQGDTPHEPDEAYARYKEWLPFTHRTEAFAHLAAENLGYDLGHAIQAPPKRPRRLNRGA